MCMSVTCIRAVSYTHLDVYKRQDKVCVRGGYHCSALCHTKLNTKERGAVRVSLGAVSYTHLYFRGGRKSGTDYGNHADFVWGKAA